MYRTHYYYFSYLRIKLIDNYVLWHLFNVFSARCLHLFVPFLYEPFADQRDLWIYFSKFWKFYWQATCVDYVLYVNFDNFLYFLFCEVERCGRRMSIFFQKRNCRSGRRCHSFELISVNEQQLNMHRKTITGRENMSLINPSSLYVC